MKKAPENAANFIKSRKNWEIFGYPDTFGTFGTFGNILNIRKHPYTLGNILKYP